MSNTSSWSIVTRIATESDASDILALTNDAFMADAFFKKPEYYDRFDSQTVLSMMNTGDSQFILASTTIDEKETNVGSMFFHWSSNAIANELHITGKFSAVSVPAKYGKRGIGKTLVKAAESRLRDIATQQWNAHKNSQDSMDVSDHKLLVSMEMGVINQRKDLFPWYEGQGYVALHELPHDEELARICLDNADIC
eukprot:CAMPEP_0174954842 /NCGR_PEP_ID=MMETSP0004_2-20121128/652_1 /TAXON_ID=420556 /ORGANISM="Ochromonas sp., Strain CCMP1393" /LENGTH=195 /DNA_ID=CAMNT_0016202707 /DNA_START=31 /DNA_END=615 /DNA_ORIENTATION=+